jgi:hypothetical protein
MTMRTVLRTAGGRPGLRRLLVPSFLAASFAVPAGLNGKRSGIDRQRLF